MPQYINGLRVPAEGSIRHIPGLGHGDHGYDVLATYLRNSFIPCVIYYFTGNRRKQSITAAKCQGIYFFELSEYSGNDSLISYYTESYPIKRVPRKYLLETVKAYRAYRMLFNEYTGIRDDIIDAVKGIECVYLGNLTRDMENFLSLLMRLGFHPEIDQFKTIRTKEGICITPDGICTKEESMIGFSRTNAAND